ncbi:MAG: hypothetical protein GY838_14390 [bacterium]|nr:hypothetical protein [bacterium]
MTVTKILTVILLVCGATAASAQSLTLGIDAMVYEQGDIMSITIANPSEQDVEFTGTPPYCVYNIVDGAQCTSLPEITTFAAGSTWVVEYDTDDGYLTVGACLVVLSWTEGGTAYNIFEDFTLTSSVPDKPVAWGALKSTYR